MTKVYKYTAHVAY